MNIVIEDGALTAAMAEAVANGIRKGLADFRIEADIAKLVEHEVRAMDLLGQIQAGLRAHLVAHGSEIVARVVEGTAGAHTTALIAGYQEVAVSVAYSLRRGTEYLSEADARALRVRVRAEVLGTPLPAAGMPEMLAATRAQLTAATAQLTTCARWLEALASQCATDAEPGQ